MENFVIRKVNQLPVTVEANALYFIKIDGEDKFETVLTDATGQIKCRLTADTGKVEFDRYDLPMANTDGVLDLSQNQIFKIDLTTGGTKTISFVNAPARAMVIVIETVGNATSLVFPANIMITDGADRNPAAQRSIITLFYDGANYFFMNNGKIV